MRVGGRRGRGGRGGGGRAVRRKKRGGSSDEEGGSSSGEEWGRAKRASRGRGGGAGRGRGKKRKPAGSDSDAGSGSDQPKKKRKSGGGFTKSMTLSEDLAAVVGTKEAPRHEVVKQMWNYIKENNLQDPKNKQFAICDEKLQKVIGVKKFKCFGMAKYLKDHMS